MITRMRGSDHKRPIVLIGDSPALGVILEEFALTELMENHPVVHISQKNGSSGLRAKPGLALSTITGNPEEPATLNKAKLGLAHSVMIVMYGEQEGDAHVLSIAEALIDSPHWKESRCPIVAVTQTKTAADCLRKLGNKAISVLCIDEIFSRIVAQVSRQPYLSRIYRELLTFRGNELYFYPAAGLTGLSYGQCLRLIPDACPSGISHGKTTRLNPPMATLLEKDDFLIVVAQSSYHITHNPTLLPAPNYAAISAEILDASHPESFLILGWNSHCPLILEELRQYTREGSRIMVIEETGAETSERTHREKTSDVQFQTGSIRDATFLSGISWECYENILIVGNDLTHNAYPLEILAKVKQVLSGPGFNNNITTVLDFPDTDVTGIDSEGLISPEIVFRITAQIILFPELLPIIQEITTPNGAEIYAKPVENYVKIDMDVDFYTIIESARLKNETAIGYIQAQDSSVTLNPAKNAKKRFHHFDKIVVFADEN